MNWTERPPDDPYPPDADHPPDASHPQHSNEETQQPDGAPQNTSQIVAYATPADESRAYVVKSSARAFQRDLYFYWSTVRAHPLSLTKAGRLYKKDLKLVNDALYQPEDLGQRNELDLPRLIFMRLLLTSLELVKPSDSVLQATDHPEFLAQRPAERIQRVFTHWRDGAFWNEALSIPEVSITDAGVEGPQSRLHPAPAQIVGARRGVLEHIAELCKAGSGTSRGRQSSEEDSSRQRWIPIQRLIERIRTTDYDFLLPRGYKPFSSQYYHTYADYVSHRSPYISYGNEMGWSFSPPFSNEAEGWQVVEAGFVRMILFEPLHWMGLLDIGYVGDVPLAYRLTPVGAWVLGVGPKVDIPEEKGRVVVQPNFELFALDPISDLTLAKLDEFADRLSAERVIKYRLTRESVYRAQKNGWTVARIIDTLNDLSQADGSRTAEPTSLLPQNIVRTLQEWQNLHERVTIHRLASLLHAADGTLLDQLTEDPAIHTHLISRVSETGSRRGASALISSSLGETEELVRALEQAGYPPVRTRSPRDAIRPSLTVVDGGTPPRMAIRFSVAIPSIYLFEQIAPFTIREEGGPSPSGGHSPSDRHYITPEAVQDAVDRGMSVDEILDRLRALHYGPLPRWAETKIRAWGHYYGEAAVQTITLVQIRDEKTLKELLSEPRLKAILHAFTPDANKALALVREEDLDSLYEVLIEHGIVVQDRLD